MLPVGRITRKHIVVRKEPFQFDEASVDLLAPLVQFVHFVPEPFVLSDQSRIVWCRHGETRATKKGTPDTAPLTPPPLRGTDEQHGPAFPFEERANVLLRLFKGLATQVSGLA